MTAAKIRIVLRVYALAVLVFWHGHPFRRMPCGRTTLPLIPGRFHAALPKGILPNPNDEARGMRYQTYIKMLLHEALAVGRR
jgi:hypothetical protein